MKNLLILNRGEIAFRILKTAKKMGYKVFVPYMAADKDTFAVRDADVAIPLTGERVPEGYNNQDQILRVIDEHKIELVHPGYGFLSENYEFREKLEDKKICFAGPSSHSMRLLGNKIEAKAMAHRLNIPTPPGSSGAVSSVEEATEVAEELGFPVMLKARGGGGGIGMHKVKKAKKLESAFQDAQKKGAMFFGDDGVFIEKLLDKAKHIEVQFLSDPLGKVYLLGTRDCSVQRRNQKVFEEGPCRFLSEETIDGMFEATRKLVRASEYIGAGTVEFLFQEGEFYFLEVNSRLQVEHLVTEATTGIDIVEQMFLIAEEKDLKIKEIAEHTGHAIEMRLYAENPQVKFLPSPGKLEKFQLPESENVRVDTGFPEGYTVTPLFDPMLAKIIFYGETRDLAIENGKNFQNKVDILGIKNNLSLIEKVLNHEEFVSGQYKTGFLESL